jgi:osomolarity two-component system sensor histidine kinase NIK1
MWGVLMPDDRQTSAAWGGATTQAEPAPGAAGGDPGRWRVLVVEDVPSQQKLLVTVLKKAGHIVSSADSGRQALELFQQRSFDIVLMDVQMPGMNGLDAMRAIREIEKDTERHVAIVAITAHALNGDEQKCLEAGADSYLRKPVRLVELMGLLKQLAGDH